MEEGGTALQLHQETQAALFDTSKPDHVIEKASGIATKLTDIVEKAKLYSMISGRKYVKVEGWTTMLAMLGVFPHVQYCKRAGAEGPIVYEARVVLKTIDGKAVGSGEAMCSAIERNWAGRDEFAIKSMAQTRATGKAARNAFSWIMSLAGYEACPAEEMVGDEHAKRPATISKEQSDALISLAKSKGVAAQEVLERAGVSRMGLITVEQFQGLWDRLSAYPPEEEPQAPAASADLDKRNAAVTEELIRGGVTLEQVYKYCETLPFAGDVPAVVSHLEGIVREVKPEKLVAYFEGVVGRLEKKKKASAA